jgi:hypothetical protein
MEKLTRSWVLNGGDRNRDEEEERNRWIREGEEQMDKRRRGTDG